jgi:hypothetical protein
MVEKEYPSVMPVPTDSPVPRYDREDANALPHNSIKKGPALAEAGLPRQRRELVAREDRVRGECPRAFAQRIGNPSLAFGPVVALTARGTLAHGQNFG